MQNQLSATSLYVPFQCFLYIFKSLQSGKIHSIEFSPRSVPCSLGYFKFSPLSHLLDLNNSYIVFLQFYALVPILMSTLVEYIVR